MTQQIEAPNGDIIEFPDNMSDAQITAVMRREYPTPAPTRQQRMQSLTPQQRQQVATLAGSRAMLRGSSPVGALAQPVVDTIMDPSRRDRLGRDIGSAAQSVVNYWSHPPSPQQWWDQTTRGIGEGLAQVPGNLANIATHPLETARSWTYGPFADEENRQQEIDAARLQGDTAALPQLAGQANADTGAAALNVGGALIPGAEAARVPAAGLRGMLGQSARAARTGALYGGVMGYALTPGGPEERAAGGAAGAGTGGVLGAVAPPVVAGVGGVARRAVAPAARGAVNTLRTMGSMVDPNAVGSMGGNIRLPPRRGAGGPPPVNGAAIDTLDRLAQRNDMNAADVEAAFQGARDNPQGQVTADLFDDAGVRTARSLVQAPGRSGRMAQDVKRTRFREMSGRIMSGLRQGLNVGRSRQQALENLNTEYGQVSAELYRPVLSQRLTPEQTSNLEGVLRQYGDDPIVEGALNRAHDIFNRDRRNGHVTGGLNENMARVAHYLKMGLDAEIAAGRRTPNGIQSTELQGIREMRANILRAIDENIPGYREARSRWGGLANAEEALDIGADLTKMAPEEAQAQLAGMTPFEREHARIGFVDEMRRNTRGGVNRAVNVARALDDPDLQAVIAQLFHDPAQAASYLDGTVNTQYRLGQNAIDWTGGSQTTSTLLHAEDNAAAAEAAGQAVTGDLHGAARTGGRHVLNTITGGMVERHNNHVGEALFRRVDTPEAQQFAQAVVAELQRRERARRSNAMISTLTTRQAAIRRNGQ